MLGARFLIFDLGAPGVPPKTPQNRSKIEVHRNTSSLVYIDSSPCLLFLRNILLETRPHGGPGSPQGCPKWGPTRLSPKPLLYGINRFVSMPTIHTKHSFGYSTPWGPREPPRAPQMGPPPDLNQNAFCMVSIDSSQCLLFIRNILLEIRPRGAPREPPRAPQMGPPPDFNQNAFCMVSIDSHTHHL